MFKRLHLLIIVFTLSQTTTMTASSLAIQRGTDFNDWWQNAVFYQIYPRSFMDSNGDGVGDLKGITSKLDYLADTGIRAVWLSPIFKSPMVDFGYDISDYTAIQPEYGTMADFEELVAQAYKVGIKIVLDFVPNHTSDQHEWFKKSAAREAGFEDFFIWSDGKLNEQGERVPPNNWPSVFYGSAWTWHEGRWQYYLHQFTKEQPDLNYRNPRVVAAMDNVLNFWLDKGVAGFRVDAVNFLFEDPALPDEPLSGTTTDSKSYEYTKKIYTRNLPEVIDMVQHWRQLLDNYTAKHDGPTRIMMTEAYGDLKVLMDYYENEKGVVGSHFPFNFNFITDVNATSDARDFVYTIEKWLIYMPRGHVANWVMGNHDNARVASRFGADTVDAMNMLLMTLPGVAVTYNGEELGMVDYRDITWAETVDPPALNAGEATYQELSRDFERTPFQWNDEVNAGFSTAAKTWLPVHSNYKTLNLAKQAAADKSHYKVYKALLELRQTPVLRSGRFTIEALSRAVFVFKRELKSHNTLLTIINVSAEEQEVDLTDFIDAANKITVEIAGVDSSYEPGQQLQASRKSSTTTTMQTMSMTSTTKCFKMAPHEAIVLKCFTMLTAERRAFIKTIIKSANILLVGLLMYKLWQGKWTKVSLYNQF